MDPSRLAIRCLFSFVFLLVMLRLSGKRGISQSSSFDFVLSLILGDVIDDFLFSEATGAQFVTSVGTLVFVALLTKVVVLHNKAFGLLVEGRPSILLRQGTAQKKALRAELLHHSDLLWLLRVKGFAEDTQNELKLAILEDSGQLSVLRKFQYKIVQKKDKKILPERKKQ